MNKCMYTVCDVYVHCILLAQMEEEIDAEISGEQPPPKRTRPMPHRAPVDMMSLDEMVSYRTSTQWRVPSEQGYTREKEWFLCNRNKQMLFV